MHFNTRQPGTRTTNLAGGVAYKHNPEMELVMAVLSTFLEDKFYESGSDRLTRIKDLVGKVSPEFVAKLAVVARSQFHLRSVSHVLIGELSRIHRGDSLVSRAILGATERPDDLIELCAYLNKPLPKQVKKGIKEALLKFSPYQLAKYRAEKHEWSLVDVFNLCHPDPNKATEEQAKAWSQLMKGELKNTETWEARLSSGENKAEVWADLVQKDAIGYMALLRNLRNIEQQSHESVIKVAAERIADKSRVEKSKQLPFRFYNAYKHTTSPIFAGAIATALDHSMASVPRFEGRTLVAVDASGSMSGDPIKKAAIFAAALAKSNNADVILYDHNITMFKYVPTDSTITITDNIIRAATGGGTNTSLVFAYALASDVKYDRIIILSDNESWQEHAFGMNHGTNGAYQNYRKINDPYVFAIDIAGYGTKDIKGDKVFHLSGWSDRILDYIGAVERGETLVDIIKAFEV